MTTGGSSLPGDPLSVDDVMAQLRALDVRQEELQVVSEELRVQQEQVTALLSRHEAEVRWRSQLAAVVPLGLALTDGNGKLLEANPALATTVGVGPTRLRGKPLSVFVSPEDALALREALRSLSGAGGGEQRLEVSLRPRGGPAQRADLFGFTETPGPPASGARVQWVLAPLHVGAEGRQPAAAPDAGPDDPDTAEGSDVVGLAGAFAQLSAIPVEEHDRQRMLGRMATLVRSAVPGADWVSITLGSPLEPQRLGSDSPEAQDFDGRQLHVQEGPCWDAYRTGRTVTSPDVRTDDRWPLLKTTAQDGAVAAVLALPVREDGESTGVINVYSARREAFGTANRRIGELAAAAVTSVLQNVAEREALASLARNLEMALTSRAVIDQAKGMLMARLGVDADEAFARLVALSSRLNVKVRDLARLVVEGDSDLVIAAGG